MRIVLERSEGAATPAGHLESSVRQFAQLSRSPLVLCLLIGIVLFGWLPAAFLGDRIALVLLDPGPIYAQRRLIGIASLTVAFTLLGLAHAAQQPRLRWMSLGLVVQATGSMLFGDLLVRSIEDFSLMTGLYGNVLSRGLMTALIAVGFLLVTPPNLTVARAVAIGGIYLLLIGGIVSFADDLPSLASFVVLPPEPPTGVTSGFSVLYWLLNGAIGLLALFVMVRSAQQYADWRFDGWIPVLTVTLAAFVIHAAFRPSFYGISTEFTSANVNLTILNVLAILGCTVSLRRLATKIAADRDALAVETKRLADLERLRTDFTTMVAHELAQPLLAIRRTAEVLELDELPPPQRRAVQSIATQANALFTMIDDLRASGETDSEDFSIEFEQVAIDHLFDLMRAFAETLPGGKPVRFEQSVMGEVWADGARIEQVLRNLLNNADRHTPPQTVITVRAIPTGASIARFEIEDDGPGITPEEVRRIFEKYGRGSSAQPGLGVGLYLSRRILRNSGSDLQYRPGATGGACFWFDLPRVSN